MQAHVFDELLRHVKLPLGTLLCDGKTYRISSDDFKQVYPKHLSELVNIDKFLVLTNGHDIVVGGVLFYGSSDIQTTIFGLMVEDNSITISEARKVIKGESKSASKMSSDSKKKKYRRTDFGQKLADILR